MDENEISRRVFGAAIEVHKYPGPGLLESVYKQCMVRKLRLQATGVDTGLNELLTNYNLCVHCASALDLNMLIGNFG